MKPITPAVKVKVASASDVRDLLYNFEQQHPDVGAHFNYTCYLLYGSWNSNWIQHSETDTILKHGNSCHTLLCECWKECDFDLDHGDDMDMTVHTVKVDQDEETMDLCVGDKQHQTLHAPSELPALFLVHRNFGKVECHQIKIDSNVLSECLIHYNSGYIPSFKSSIMESYRSSISLVKMRAKQLGTGIHMLTTADYIGDKTINADNSSNEAIRIFITGDRSQVGKSSVCLGLIGTLLTKYNYNPSSLAYIKPATQCEESQLIAKYCKKHNIDSRPIGPIVYYKGFTRAFLDGETDSTETLLRSVKIAVDKLAMKKKIIIIDGVGYPAVGSICGTDNVSVAKACGYESARSTKNGSKEIIPPAVLIVGKRGVGDAIDSYNLNATYFKARDVKVMGAIFNRLPNDKNHYYSLENCKKAVTAYFAKSYDADEEVYGFIPELEGLSSKSMESADEFVKVFAKHVDVGKIIDNATKLRDAQIGITSTVALKRIHDDATMSHGHVQKKIKLLSPSTQSWEQHSQSTSNSKLNGSQRIRLTREQIESTAKSQGAAGG